MRRQKYRIWHIERKVMLIAYNLAFTDEYDEPLACESVQVRLDDGWKWLEDDEFILLEFTGLKDRNGKEDYVGDVWEVEFRGFIYRFLREEIITWQGYEFGFKCINGVISPVHANINEDGIIIGSIHENPKLLEKNNGR